MACLSKLRLWMVCGLLLCAQGTATSVHAQPSGDEYQEPRRPRSLSQRLEQFRKDLLGSEAEEEMQPAPRRSPQTTRPGNSAQARSSAGAAQMQPAEATPRGVPRSSAPASRVVNRGPQRDAGTPRVAARPEPTESEFTEPVPVEAGEPESSYQEPLITDETRRSKLAPVTARPARRGGAFELPTPRMARQEQMQPSVDEMELEEESTGAFEEPMNDRSAASNVLITSKNPVLTLEATGPRTVLVGREAQFKIVVRNIGDTVASGVMVKVNIPAYVDVVGSDVSQGTAVAPAASTQQATMEWKLDRLDLRGTETLTLKVIPRKSVPLDLAMQWTCKPEMSQAVVQVQEAKLSLSLAGPREIFYGQSKIYKLTISNPGNGDAENVSVSLMPVGRTGDAPSNYRLGVLRAGDSKTVDIELTARQAGKLEIKAHAIGDGGLRADVVEPVVVRRAELKIAVAGAKVKYAGTPSVYRIRVANVGDAVSEGVDLSAMFPPDAKFLKASDGGKYDEASASVVWNIGAMQPGDDRTYDMHCVLMAPGENPVQVMVRSKDDLNATAGTVTQVEALADLKLEVRDPRGPVAIGDGATYEVVVRNRGTKAAEGIEIVTFFSEGLEADSVQGIEHQISPGQVVMKTIEELAAGAEATIQVHCKADRGGNLVFRAEVNCRNPGTKLAAEETTHFYGDGEIAASPMAGRADEEAVMEEEAEEVPVEIEEEVPAAMGEPTPAAEDPAPRYPGR